MFSLICALINGGANNGEAGDLGRHRTHYDVTAMKYILWAQAGSKRALFSAEHSTSHFFNNGDKHKACDTKDTF